MTRDLPCGVVFDPCCSDYYYGSCYDYDECYSYAEPCQVTYVRRTSDDKKKSRTKVKKSSKSKTC